MLQHVKRQQTEAAPAAAAAADRKGLKRQVKKKKSEKLAREVEMRDEQWQPLRGAVGVALWQVRG